MGTSHEDSDPRGQTLGGSADPSRHRLLAHWARPHREPGTFGAAPAFAPTDQLGRPITSSDFRTKVILTNFNYTNCRDICPLLSFRMQQLQARL